jgi:glycosyltransferase involved in cell wall biosynthesis
MSRRLNVLVLARSYPSPLFPELGLWTARPTSAIAQVCDVNVISPVPYFPPLPQRGRLREYARFRQIPRSSSSGSVTVHWPRFVVGPGSSLYRFEARAYSLGVRRAAERIRAKRPVDLIHAHFIYPDGAAGAELARRWGVPLVVTEHAPWNGWLERPGVRRPALAGARQASRVIAVSRYVRDSIASYTGDPEKIVVIPNGVDAESYRPAAPGARKPDQILYVGVINFNKGIDVLLRAMKHILAARAGARLLLAGGNFYRNTRLQREALERMAVELGLGEAVSFLGHLPPADVARLMAESGVVVLPSRAESFGSVLIEALACGTPVVATRSGGPEDIVDDAFGTLVEKDDPDALAAAIVDVLERSENYDPDVIRELALSRFSWDHVVGQTLQVYEEVTAG